MSLRIFIGATFPDDASSLLREGLAGRDVVVGSAPTRSNLVSGIDDQAMDDADICFGQPAIESFERARRLKWVHLTSAGYTRYASHEVTSALRTRGIALTTSSTVYAEPCATHALALILSMCRRLPQCDANQQGERAWPSDAVRRASRVLSEQRVAVLGFGAIGRRLAELLWALGARVVVVREHPRGDEPVETVTWPVLMPRLGEIDIVVNTLPEASSTRGIVDARFFASLRSGALFVNVGRGTTVDQDALLRALQDGTLEGAALDVTDPEPLPPEHPLWRTPGCIVTPHSAGGRATEFKALVRHFLENLARFERGDALGDRVI
ncbi:MAG: D-2-hydroxyacid dehydrogenase [Polyangiaceae bacterium]|nr:D-2-hydroxyacid dehydrogenase [Polyangiaceae bacterium]